MQGAARRTGWFPVQAPQRRNAPFSPEPSRQPRKPAVYGVAAPRRSHRYDSLLSLIPSPLCGEGSYLLPSPACGRRVGEEGLLRLVSDRFPGLRTCQINTKQALTVSDLARAEHFYDKALVAVLGFRKNSFTLGGDPHIQYFNRHFGFVLRPARVPAAHDAYAPGLHHFCLRVETAGEVHEAASALRATGIEASEARVYPQYALVVRRTPIFGLRRVDRRRVQGAKHSQGRSPGEHSQRRNRLRAAGENEKWSVTDH